MSKTRRTAAAAASFCFFNKIMGTSTSWNFGNLKSSKSGAAGRRFIHFHRIRGTCNILKGDMLSANFNCCWVYPQTLAKAHKLLAFNLDDYISNAQRGTLDKLEDCAFMLTTCHFYSAQNTRTVCHQFDFQKSKSRALWITRVS